MSNKKQPSPAKQAYEEKKAAKQEAKKKVMLPLTRCQRRCDMDSLCSELERVALAAQHAFFCVDL